ncbi:MAG TPA: MBL fold metallo-hydrolase [Ferruginibacter sp.]|nr:MBL fold metallo-hydrolase [Ferruginibacter sp.]HMP20874.1 MBL fold metallo-hydrolase [Ferruginibacter sp.]
MQRRYFIRNSSILLTAMGIGGSKAIAQLLDEPAWKITMLTDTAGYFTERGGTILFLLTKEGYVVADSQFPDTAQHLIDELKRKKAQPFRLLINTHHHGDHSGGNIAFKGLTQQVLAHENAKFNQEFVAKERKTEDKQLYPNQTYTDTWCEKIGKDEVCLHYFGAGHTNGDSLVHFVKQNIVHLGDLFFNRRHPHVDKNAGASLTSWITVLDKAQATFGTKARYVCGHAAPGFDVQVKPDELKMFGDYLGRVLNFTESEIRAGKTVEEIVKATALPGEKIWVLPDGLERPLRAAYRELTEPKN